MIQFEAHAPIIEDPDLQPLAFNYVTNPGERIGVKMFSNRIDDPNIEICVGRCKQETLDVMKEDEDIYIAWEEVV